MTLDTNALSAWADGDKDIRQHLESADQVVLPIICVGEYLFGIRQSRYRTQYEKWLEENLLRVEVGMIGTETAKEYASLRLELKQQASPIPANDVWIAALARQYELPVLSRDTHFDHVRNLRRIGW
jgi:tRNA(fMet)-specific endonuclease VapC